LLFQQNNIFQRWYTVLESVISGRVGLQQRVFPLYRAPFVNKLAEYCPDGLSVFAGLPLAIEQIPVATHLDVAQFTQGKNIHLKDPSSSWYLCWQPDLIRWLESWNPEILILEANPRYLSSRKAIRWMHTRSRPVIGWGLGAPPVSGVLAGFRRWERQSFLNNLDGVIAYSHRGAEEYLALGMPRDRVFVAPNSAAPRPTWKLPERSDVLNRRLRVLFVGRLQARKRLDLLFNACAALPEVLQPEVIVVGDGPARQEFVVAAERNYPFVTFMGAQSGPALEASFRSADLFVLPGTGGLAVQQALSYGLPVIVARGDGTQDDLVGPDNGWQIPPEDGEALSHALSDALEDIPRLRQKGRVSFRIACEEANLDRMAEVFAQAVQTILSMGLRRR
jgi:glycosyltransferase involved in cell wall biosynthesis